MLLFFQSSGLCNLTYFLSPRTSIGFHKRLKITSIDFHKRSFLKEFSSMGSLNLQMRPTADFSFIRSGCFYHASMQFVKHGV